MRIDFRISRGWAATNPQVEHREIERPHESNEQEGSAGPEANGCDFRRHLIPNLSVLLGGNDPALGIDPETRSRQLARREIPVDENTVYQELRSNPTLFVFIQIYDSFDRGH
jgi:hypothetical protein